MSVVVLISDAGQFSSLLGWGARFAHARRDSLHVGLWTFTERDPFPHLAEGNAAAQSPTLLEASQTWLEDCRAERGEQLHGLDLEQIRFHSVAGPDLVDSALEFGHEQSADLLILPALGPDPASIRLRETHQSVLRRIPFDTLIFFHGGQSAASLDKIFVGTAGNSNDLVSVTLAAEMTRGTHAEATLVHLESDPSRDAVEVGKRELEQLLRVADVGPNERIRSRVFLRGDDLSVIREALGSQLLLLSADGEWPLEQAEPLVPDSGVALVKRAPPLKNLGGQFRFKWLAPLMPATYADLMQGLRRDSRLTEEFLVMLGLAAAIASLGLLQDSPAVVIGSMLLAPLMTPMIGCGLAMSQANPQLGRSSLWTIFIGFLMTLLISTLIGLVVPGEDLTLQVLARGKPNLLDLLVAILAGAAAAYSMARPNVAGAVAGVAIATALVPPLCSSGIAFAYREWMIGLGATVLFLINGVAIIGSAAITFRALGVSSVRLTRFQRKWVFRVAAILGGLILLLSIPLERALEKSILEGRAQPTFIPLVKSISDQLVAEVERLPGVQVVSCGRPGSVSDSADIVIVLASDGPVDDELANRLAEIVRREMKAPDLIVEVFCLDNRWHRELRPSQ